MATKEQKSGKIFYGWWVVLAAGSWARSARWPHHRPHLWGIPQTLEPGVWLEPDTDLAGIFLFTLGATLTVPVIGRLVDRFGARKVIVPAVLLFGLRERFVNGADSLGGWKPNPAVRTQRI